ncbi:MAG: type II toxin-antitoxin system RelE/ParE family toxin [Phycisphaeraceae bacterium]|nr:type II toxin-antitoxin system RelE/ParE family toxin [Phycisphaeraceae bacterium]
MMRRIVFTPEADEDVDVSYAYLFARSPQAADRFIDAVDETAHRVAKYPGTGSRWRHGKTDLPELRRIRLKHFDMWLMLYLPEPGVLRVVRVVHGARDLGSVSLSEF